MSTSSLNVAPKAGSARLVQEIERVSANRDFFGGKHQLEAGVGQVFQLFQTGRVIFWEDHHQPVLGEGLLSSADDPSGLDDHIHLFLVGAGKHIRRRAFVDLLGELLRAGEVEYSRHSGMISLEQLPDLAERLGE